MSSIRGAGRKTYHGSLHSYITGFLLALILTALPFWLIMTAAAPARFLLPAVLILGVAQIGVHLRYFLHIGLSSEKRWDLVALVLAAVVAVVVIGGSLWVIRELDHRMMPYAMTMERNHAAQPQLRTTEPIEQVCCHPWSESGKHQTISPLTTRGWRG